MSMKLLIIFSIIALIKSDCEPSNEDELMQLKKLREYDDCSTRTTKDELEDMGAYSCCHIYYTIDSNNLYKEVDTCILVTKNQYDNIKKFVDDLEEYQGYKHTKIHCNGFNIKFNLLILLFLLFLI